MKETRAVLLRQKRRKKSPAGRPRKLDRKAVIKAAEDMMLERGAPAMTLRSLGARLGVGASTLYTYFDNLEQVEAAALDQIVAGIPKLDLENPKPITDQILDLFDGVRTVQMRNPKILTGPLGSASWKWSMRRANNVLKVFSALGADDLRAVMVYQALIGLTLTSAAEGRDREEKTYDERREMLRSIDASEVDFLTRLFNEWPALREPSNVGFRRMLRDIIGQLLPWAADHDNARRNRKSASK